MKGELDSGVLFPIKFLSLTAKGLFMKDNLGSDYFLLAHVDLENVQMKNDFDLGIEFMNEIDAWSKMAFKFRGHGRGNLRFAKNDLSPLVYGFRISLPK